MSEENATIEQDTESLDGIVEESVRFAKAYLARKRELNLMISGFTPEGGMHILEMPVRDNRDKDNLITLARVVFHREGVGRYVVMSESWVVLGMASQDTSVPPSESPDRKEVLMVFAFDNRGNSTGVMHEMLRNSKGRFKKLGGPIFQGGADITKGRLADLLSPLARPTPSEEAWADERLHRHRVRPGKYLH